MRKLCCKQAGEIISRPPTISEPPLFFYLAILAISLVLLAGTLLMQNSAASKQRVADPIPSSRFYLEVGWVNDTFDRWGCQRSRGIMNDCCLNCLLRRKRDVHHGGADRTASTKDEERLWPTKRNGKIEIPYRIGHGFNGVDESVE